MTRLSHLAADGSARMVDVSAKPVNAREAVAAGRISLRPETLALIAENKIAKGNVFATARIAAVQAAKQTPHLIPLCHGLNLTHVDLEIAQVESGVEVRCSARTAAQTGVEMEALTGVSLALLTIYDMCKAVDKEMRITDVRLLKKTKRDVAAMPSSQEVSAAPPPRVRTHSADPGGEGAAATSCDEGVAATTCQSPSAS